MLCGFIPNEKNVPNVSTNMKSYKSDNALTVNEAYTSVFTVVRNAIMSNRSAQGGCVLMRIRRKNE